MNFLETIYQIIYNNLLFIGHGYTITKTVVFGLLLGIIVLGIIKLFQYLKKDPSELFIPLIPFIFIGSCARALVDNHIYPQTLYTVTPGIYILVGSVTIITLLSSILIEKYLKIKYTYTILTIGLILTIPNIINLQTINIHTTLMVILPWLLISTIFILLRKHWTLINNKWNLLTISAHIFDATTTFIGVDFLSYYEQHVLPGTLTSITGTALILYPLKIIVILLALYYIDNYIEDPTVQNTLKLCIFILGLAPGMRNFFSMAMATI